MNAIDKGLTLWFTGLSGSGKSTLATYLTPKLKELGKKVEGAKLELDLARLEVE